MLRAGVEAALDRGRARVSLLDRSRDSSSMPRGLRERVDPLDLEVEAAGRDPVVPARGRARTAPRLADVAAATLPGALRERARAAEPVSPLVAARPCGRGDAAARRTAGDRDRPRPGQGACLLQCPARQRGAPGVIDGPEGLAFCIAQLHVFGHNEFLVRPQLFPQDFQWKQPPYEYEYEALPIDLIIGNRSIRKRLENLENLEDITAAWQAELADYNRMRRDFLLYT